MFKKKFLGTSKEIYYSLDSSMHLQPASKYMPQWFKDMPYDYNDDVDNFPINNKELIPNGRTLKRCPSFIDVFKQGYVFVAPCDYWLSYKEETNEFWWQVSNEKFALETHDPNQFQGLVPESGVKAVYKVVNTLQMIAPKGYSVWQMPMMYHYKQSQDWYVPYGVIDVDTHHEVNPQIFYASDKKEILIKKGTPLCYIVPFKREATKIVMKPFKGKLRKKVLLSESKTFNYFSLSYARKRNEKD